MFVAGAAGIGKSVLIDDFVERHSTEAQVLEADADESETDLAFGVLENLLAGMPIPLAGRLKGVITGQMATPEPLAVPLSLRVSPGPRERVA